MSLLLEAIAKNWPQATIAEIKTKLPQHAGDRLF